MKGQWVNVGAWEGGGSMHLSKGAYQYEGTMGQCGCMGGGRINAPINTDETTKASVKRAY